jgi:hypothetical protein
MPSDPAQILTVRDSGFVADQAEAKPLQDFQCDHKFQKDLDSKKIWITRLEREIAHHVRFSGSRAECGGMLVVRFDYHSREIEWNSSRQQNHKDKLDLLRVISQPRV